MDEVDINEDEQQSGDLGMRIVDQGDDEDLEEFDAAIVAIADDVEDKEAIEADEEEVATGQPVLDEKIFIVGGDEPAAELFDEAEEV